MGAVVLTVVAIVFFGSSKLFSVTEDFIVYFDEPVDGLAVGAPVKFRGVPIGSVKNIYIRFNQGPETDHIPVIITLDISLLNDSLGVDVDIRDQEVFNQIVNEGYRAQLVSELITGLKYIQIDIDPDARPRRPIQEEYIYKEFPSKPSLTAELGQTATEIIARLGTIDIQTINDELVGILRKANAGLGELDFRQINESFIAAADSAKETLSNPKIEKALDDLSSALEEYEMLAEDLRSKINPVLAEAKQTNADIQETLAGIRTATEQVRFVLSSDSSFRYEIENALAELAAAAESINMLAQQLERNPKSLLTGKAQPGQEVEKK